MATPSYEARINLGDLDRLYRSVHMTCAQSSCSSKAASVLLSISSLLFSLHSSNLVNFAPSWCNTIAWPVTVQGGLERGFGVVAYAASLAIMLVHVRKLQNCLIHRFQLL